MNDNNIELVVFDMAGTTVDEKNVVYKTVHKALVKHGVHATLEQVLEFGAGKEKHQAIKDVIAAISPNFSISSNIIFEDFKTMLDEAYQTLEVSPIKGVDSAMLSLKDKGIKVVLNTGYNRKIATLLINKLGWKLGIDYDMLITADDIERGRPHPDMIHKAMAQFGIKDSLKVLKAGDSAIDVEEGKNANCGITIGVLSGAQTKQQLETVNPSYIIDSLASIQKTLGL